jgi:DNA polymerase-3 subunit delta'
MGEYAINDWGVIGHDWAVNQLRSAIDAQALAQSHLFVGPPQVGKAALARATARALLGLDDRKRRLVEAYKHPDLSWIEPDGDGDSIKVEAVRTVLHTLSLAPVESPCRVAVIDQSHLVTDSGKNALLKTLEEPNPRVVIILTAPSVDAVLPTIASRCQVTHLRLAPFAAIRDAVQVRGQAPERAALIARLARGRVGWALRAIADDAILEERRARLEDLTQLLAGDSSVRFAFSEKLAKREGAEIHAVLEEWLWFWRDVGQTVSGAPEAGICNGDHGTLLRRLADALDIGQVREQMQGVMRAAERIDQNVNARLTLDTLLLRMPRMTQAS